MSEFNVNKKIKRKDDFSPQTADEIVLQRKSQLMRDNPFLSYLLQSATIVETDQIPTMAMTPMGHLMYNPRFVEALLKAEVSGVLTHEILHLALRTFPRQRGREMDMWNIATDLHINYFVKYNTADNIDVPEELDMRELIPEDHELRDKIPEEADTVSEFYVPDSNGKFTYEYGEDESVTFNVNEQSAEEIYDILSDIQEEQEGEGGNEGEGQGQGGDITDELGNGNGPTEGTFDNIYSEDEIVVSDSEEDGKKKIELPDGAEVEVPEESLEDQNWDEITASAQQHATQRGDMPAGMEDMIESSDKNQIDWKKYIHQVIRQNIPSGYKWDRPSAVTLGNPNTPYLPGRDQSEKLSVIAVIDTSGSVSDELLSQFLGEVSGIINQNKQCELVVIYHDADVQKVDEYSRPKSSELDEVEIKGRGGTDHVPVFEYIQENYMSGNYRTDPTIVINLTDGYTNTPDKNDWPKFDQCLWIIPNHEVGMDRLTKGEIVRVEPDEY